MPYRALLLALFVLAPACNGPGGKGPDTAGSTTTSTGASTGETTLAPTADPMHTTTAPTSGSNGSDTSTGTPGTSTTSTTTGDARCGDGTLQAPEEECDDGEDNGLGDCTPECKFNVCGDGFFRLGVEECDGGPDCDGECRRSFHRVFVSAEALVGALDGFAGADALCQGWANDAGLVGNWKAWVGSAALPVSSRFVHSSRPYRVAYTGASIADDWDDLVDGTIGAPINITDKSEILDLGQSCAACPVWTGTSAGGLPLAGNCADWTAKDADAVGAAGSCTLSDMRWTEGCPDAACQQGLRIYCFEQAIEP